MFLNPCANPLGKPTDYAIRVKLQALGSPHAHTLLWIEGAPKYGVDDDQVIYDFVDQYFTCKIPLMMKNSNIWCYLYSSTVIVDNEDHADLIFPNQQCKHFLEKLPEVLPQYL